MAKKRKNPTWFLKLLLYCLGVFLFQELVIRACFPLPEISNFDRSNYVTNSQNSPFSRNQSLQWFSTPDTLAAFVSKMNRYGFRDKEWSLQKPAGKKRVLFIGDSFIEGTMAMQDETIPIAFNKASGMKYEVMNGGMLGTAVDHYLQLAADMVPLFKPDVVFLTIYGNDMRKQEPVIPEFYLEPTYFNFFTPRLVEMYRQAKTNGPIRFRWTTSRINYLPAVPQELNPWSKKEAKFSAEVLPKIAFEMKSGKFNPYVVCKICKEEYSFKQPARLVKAIDFFGFLCKKFGAQPAVLYIPSRNQVTNYYIPFERTYCKKSCASVTSLTDSTYQIPQRTIADMCQTFGVPFFDLTEVVREKEAQGIHLYWNYDEHMRARGYQLLGEAIWEQASSLKRIF